MALSQPDLLRLMESLRTADGIELIRAVAQRMLQELIEAEATARIGVDQALYAVIMEAYVLGVSTRSVDDLVKALGADTDISKSEVSRICADLDEQLTAFRDRPLGHTRFPYVYLDAAYCKARVNHQIVSGPWWSPPASPRTAAGKCSA